MCGGHGTVVQRLPGRSRRHETGVIPWSCKTGNVSARKKGPNLLIVTPLFPIPGMNEAIVGGVGWLQIVKYQFNSDNWELLKIMGTDAIRYRLYFETSSTDPLWERTEDSN